MIKNLLPPERFEKKFSVGSKVISAKLYAFAFGIYEGAINGERIGENYFAPGYSHYQSELQFQAYDITEKLKSENTLWSNVANDWYLSTIGRKNNNYGKQRGLIAELSESLEMGYGPVRVQWKHERDTHFYLQVTIPANIKAEIILPNGKHHLVGSGTYQFD